MILNNKVSQRLEIIGFKGSVKKSTSRIQVMRKPFETMSLEFDCILSPPFFIGTHPITGVSQRKSQTLWCSSYVDRACISVLPQGIHSVKKKKNRANKYYFLRELWR